MKQVQNPRRSRSRSGPGKRHQPSKNRNFESNGGEAKVRGNAQQVLDKYQAMARDAAAAGEHIQAEGYWQHAEHYYRILNADKDNRPVNRGSDDNQNQNQNNDNENSTDGEEAPRAEQSKSREIRIESAPEAAAETVAEAGNSDHVEAANPVRLTEQPAAPVEPQAEKPKRRGRPAKAAVKVDEAPEADESETDASVETVSA